MVSAYLFWLIISRFTTAEVIGVSATIVSIAGIATTVVNMGIPISVQRFLGKAFGSQRTEDMRTYILSSILLLTISLAICSTLMIATTRLIHGILSFDNIYLILTIFLIASSSISRLFRGIIIASINTKTLTFAALYSAVAKFVVAYAVLLLGMGAIGLVIAVISFAALESAFMLSNIRRILLYPKTGVLPLSIRNAGRALLTGGMPNWVPNMIAAAGSQLGTILVFGSHGANQAGVYFIAFSIYTGLATAMGVLFSITYPVLSSLDTGREKLSARTIKLSLLSTVPLSYSMIFFADQVMNIFGNSYVSGSLALQVLLASLIPVAVQSGVTNLVYSFGKYRYALYLGIASSLPRTILYFLLVPILGSSGAAVSFTLGSLVGLVFSIYIAKRVDLSNDWKVGLFIFALPVTISYFLGLLHINFVLSILISTAASYILYIKIHVMTRADIHDMLKVLPKRLEVPAILAIDLLGRKLDKSY